MERMDGAAMRRYFYLECNDPRRLDEVPGCHYVADPHRGHGAELWFDGATSADYPRGMALVTPLPGGLLQVTPIDPVAGERLAKLLVEGADKAGLVVHDSAKTLDAARPELAAVCCYEQRVVTDKDGKPIGTEKKPGAPLTVALVLAGNDPIACADQAAIVEAPPKEK